MPLLTSLQRDQLTRKVGDTELSRKIAEKGSLAGATVTVSAEGATTANTRDIILQLTDGLGNNLTERTSCLVSLFLDGNGDAVVATGGSTGISLGAAGGGLVYPLIAKKVFLCVSEADGSFDLDWLDSGTEAAYIAILLPNGKLVFGDAALTNG
jgi:hypothetical protein